MGKIFPNWSRHILPLEPHLKSKFNGLSSRNLHSRDFCIFGTAGNLCFCGPEYGEIFENAKQIQDPFRGIVILKIRISRNQNNVDFLEKTGTEKSRRSV